MSFSRFITALTEPMSAIAMVLLAAVVIVNGGTDAPNAISSCVSTKVMRIKTAVIMAAVFNFAGVTAMCLISSSVAQTVYSMVDMKGDGVTIMCAAMFAVVGWSVAAWAIGIPTSESHALFAGLTGAALAFSPDALVTGEWLKIIYGLLLSTGCGFGFGYLGAKCVQVGLRGSDLKKTNKFFSHGQIVGGAMSAFMHGAQDGQKFLGVFMLIFASESHAFVPPIWLILGVSLLMFAGTYLGGVRIIKKVGVKMTKPQIYQGFCADFASAVCLLCCSLSGLPVSTTHTKTSAVAGVGCAKNVKSVDWKIVGQLVLAWLLTFPLCALIGYICSAALILFL